jgi:hypothetical protein
VQVRGALELPATAEGYLRRLAGELDTAYRNAATALDEHPDLVWLEHDHRRDRLHVTRLDAIEEGESTVELRDHLHALLPRVDLPELLVEVDHWTGFSDEFTHLSGADTVR